MLSPNYERMKIIKYNIEQQIKIQFLFNKIKATQKIKIDNKQDSKKRNPVINNE